MKEAGHNSMLTLYNFSVLSFPTSHPQLKLNVLNSTPRDMVGVGGAIRAAQRAHDKHIHSPGEDYDQSEGLNPISDNLNQGHPCTHLLSALSACASVPGCRSTPRVRSRQITLYVLVL